MKTTITLREYLNKNKIFKVPYYQRGYIWGKKREDGGKDSASHMMDSLITGYQDRHQEVFIQGFTVSENEKEITLIDGQQRTTFFYLLLNELGYKESSFEIKYEVRDESDTFLSRIKKNEVLEDISDNNEEEYQDLYFFKKALRIIREKLKPKDYEIDPEAFLQYVLDKVRFLYIVIPESKAVTTFTIMNGNKAIMKPDELVKAELLRIVSLNEYQQSQGVEELTIEWEHHMTRSRYAREWDRWLQWWNREEVRALFRTQSIMGLLLTTYYHSQGDDLTPISFARFKEEFLPGSKPKEAKDTFDGLRRLQKRFEDAFNTPIVYNKIGAILRVIKTKEDRNKFIQWYFSDAKPSDEELDRYYRLAFIGATHKEILENQAKVIKEKYENTREQLENNNLYWDYPKEAFLLLLRLNIDEDNKQANGQGRKFDFTIWDNGRSLEHIYPKSKVYHVEKEGNKNVYKDGAGCIINQKDNDSSYIRRDSCEADGVKTTEHSIGNLVLLYGDENSSFSNSSFDEKKAMFFKKSASDDGKASKEVFKSRHLLHTIYKFSNSKWTGEDIAKNKRDTLNEFENYYKELIADETEK